jgi:TolB-like protein/Tfp pilus assembly protein PilF
MSLFEELKRRNVLRVGTAYVVVAWLIIQVVETIFPAFGFGDPAVRFATIVLAIGLIPTLVLAWAFELTPEGLKKEKDVDRSRSIAPRTGKKLDRIIMAVLAIALSYFAFDKFVLSESRDASIPASEHQEGRGDAFVDTYGDKSIAVLPFANLSDDAGNEYFSDGISEEILNLLAKIPELRVISRSSAFAYKGKEVHIPDVAQKLRVSHVLEGSVRKSGVRVRITVQLIDARSDKHLWSQTFDRTLDDIFAVQDEISAAVVDSLKITLIEEAPASRPVDPEAYALYLRGKSVAQIHSEENLQQGAKLLLEALGIEPEFADAWAALASIRTNQAGRNYLPKEEGATQARIANERALEINPGNAAARSGLCWIQMYYEWDIVATSACVQSALEFSPRNASVLNIAATFYGNIGRLDLALDAYQKAQETDPLSASIIFNLVLAYLDAGQIDNAATQLEVGRSLYSDEPFVDVFDAAIALRRGMPEDALTRAENMPGSMGSWIRGFAYHDLARPADVDFELKQLESSGATEAAYIMASLYAYRGDADAAFGWLERSFESGDTNLVEMRDKYFWEKIHDDPRWQPFLARIGISDADIAALGY